DRLGRHAQRRHQLHLPGRVVADPAAGPGDRARGLRPELRGRRAAGRRGRPREGGMSGGPGNGATDDVVLRVHDLRVTFASAAGAVEAVRGVDLEVRRGRVVALVGESGSGKSVTSLSALGLLPSTARVTGTVELADGDVVHDVVTTPEQQLVDLRGRVVSMVFQEPMTALNPTMTLGDQVAEAVLNHERVPRAVAHERAVELLRAVGVP